MLRRWLLLCAIAILLIGLAGCRVLHLQPSQDPYNQGIQIAQQAVACGQTAKTPKQWNKCALSWKQASELMASVQRHDPRYQVARSKSINYRKNMEMVYKKRAEAAEACGGALMYMLLNLPLVLLVMGAAIVFLLPQEWNSGIMKKVYFLGMGLLFIILYWQIFGNGINCLMNS